MRPTVADIQRRIDALVASSQSPFIVFVKAVFEGEEVIDRAVYATVDEALQAFKQAYRITSDKSVIFIDDVPEDEERAGSGGIVGYTLEN